MDPYQYILSYSGYDSGNPQTLTIPPIGWNESGIAYERSDFYHSVFRSYSDTIKFARKSGAASNDVGGGGDDIILFAYEHEGIEAVINCAVNKRNPQTNDYDLFYYGILDFNPDKFSWDEEYVEISFIDGHKEVLFKTRDDINFDINSVTSADDVTVDSFVSQPANIGFTPINIYSDVNTQGGVNDTATVNSTSPTQFPLYWTNGENTLNEIKDRLSTSDGVIYENNTNDDTTIRLNDLDFVLSLDITYNPLVSGDNTAAPNIFLTFVMLDENDNVVYYPGGITNPGLIWSVVLEEKEDITSSYNYTDLIGFNFSGAQNFYYSSYELNVPAGYKLTIEYLLYGNLAGVFDNMEVIVEMDTIPGELDFTEISLGEPDEDILCYYPHEAFTRLIQLMTSETDTSKLLYSSKLGRTDSEFQTYSSNGSASVTVLTSGWNLRKFPSKPFNLSMKDLFKAYDSIYNIGLGYDRVNDRFYIEDKEQFYNSGLLMFDLGEVNDVVIKPYENGYYSEILCGYQNKVNPEEFQGANEYCVKSEYSLTVPVKNSLDLLSALNASSIEMELLRRLRYKNYRSEDSQNDDNIYVVVTTGGHVLVNGTYSSGFEGVDEYYNIDITPRENLIRWGNFINVPMWKKDPFDVKFIKSQKGLNVSYINQNGNTVNELDDIASTELSSSKLFRPELLSCNSKITTAMMTQLNTNPHGIVKCSQNGTNYYGFLKYAKTYDYNRRAEWELILTDAFAGNNYVFEDGNNYIFQDGNNFIFND